MPRQSSDVPHPPGTGEDARAPGVETQLSTQHSALRTYCSLLGTHYSALVAPFLGRCWIALKRVLGILAWFVGPLFLVGCAFILFRDSLVEGLVYYRNDTVVYYFPLADRFGEVLRQGRLMLWTPYIFGGFPLFADGEVGMLYPPNLLGYFLASSDAEAFTWLRIIKYGMAGLFSYFYLRALKLNGFAATVGALSFALGSFMVAQMHHTNVTNTAIWLPLTLCFVELSLRNVRQWRWIFAILAGVSMGIQALGLHIQPLILSGFFLAFYIPFRVLLCPLAWPKPRQGKRRTPVKDAIVWIFRQLWRTIPVSVKAGASRHVAGPIRSTTTRLRDASVRPFAALAALLGRYRPARWSAWLLRWAWWGLVLVIILAGRFVANVLNRVVLAGLLLGMIPAIAFGMTAIQTLPLVELGLFSFRGQGVNYQFSTSFSLPLQNLVNLVFPYFFRYTNREYYWSLWAEWETTLYVGIAPLALAILAIIFVRRKLVLFFAVMAGVSLVLAFGGYSPYPLWDQIRSVPGFSSLRVPGRFTMLTTFSLSVLAGFGVDWLCRTLRPTDRSQKSRWGRLSRLVGTNGFALYLMGLAAAIAAVAWWLVNFHVWIEKEPGAVKAAIQQTYLSLRNDRPWLNPDQVLTFLSYTLDISNPRTAMALALMGATFLLLFAWFAFRPLWRAWASLLVLLVAADMLFFATDFHPTMPMSQLTTPNAVTKWLMDNNPDGRTRVYSLFGIRKTEPNKLLPFQVSEITGYSSLQTKRHQEYMAKLRETEKTLLDLFSTRFLVMQKNPTALPSYKYAGYNPNLPLAEGASGNRNAHSTLYMSPPVRADEVRVISSLRDSVEIPQNTEVAEIVVVDVNGERETLKMKAGVDTAEWAYDRPDVTIHMRHLRPELAAQHMMGDGAGRQFQANFYFAGLKLSKTRTVQRVEYHYTSAKGKGWLYGAALWENPSTAHQVLGRYRYVPRYQDEDVAIVENLTALPRTFLVGSARMQKQGDILEIMAHGDFDPRTVALLEPADRSGPLPDEGGADERVLEFLRGNPGGVPGRADIASYGSTEIVVRTAADRNSLLFLADSYYPGWNAYVDGREEKVYRANYLFRAVQVPAGEHEVRFAFEPKSVAIGESISRFTLETLAVLLALLLFVPPTFKVTAWVIRRVRRRLAGTRSYSPGTTAPEAEPIPAMEC